MKLVNLAVNKLAIVISRSDGNPRLARSALVRGNLFRLKNVLVHPNLTHVTVMIHPLPDENVLVSFPYLIICLHKNEGHVLFI
ncbi:hypothetical protein ABE45_32340 [Bacillus thuringiensis]|nr:hypothetical protein [Bacillus thuringiensis]MBG9509890.1 hypothetical protein [Bacillus thuringiensis]MBG9509892.1 hypothetical protein [Bacillus thuringiensis]MBG9510225.1 hypothetical protein [Bacillus thuringiensis]